MNKQAIEPSIIPLKEGITALRKAHEKQERWQATFNEMFDGGMSRPLYFYDIEHGLIETLKAIYHDDYVIENWIYNQDFGRLPNSLILNTRNLPVRINTIEDLYRYLMAFRFYR